MSIKIIIRLILNELSAILEQQIPLTSEEQETQLDKLLSRAKEETRVMAWDADSLGITRPHILVAFVVDGSVVYADIVTFVGGKTAQEVQSADRILRSKLDLKFYYAKDFIVLEIDRSRQSETR